jgi:hypothetical protein
LDHSLDAVFQSLYVEIDQQAYPYSGELHIGEQLRLVDRGNLVYTFQFHDQPSVDQQVNPVAAVERDPLVLHGQRAFDERRYLHQRQFVGKASLVR